MKPVIVCIAKLESKYIEEFVKYHLAIGFQRIYIFDNEDVPTYENLLQKYADNITFIHFPFNNYHMGVQYVALQHFVNHYLYNDDITHVAHIDIDEFIVLKKHANICDFITEYIKDDCAGIGMNWRFFGSSHRAEESNEPVTQRFTMCDSENNKSVISSHIKTIFDKDHFKEYCTCHTILTKNNTHIKIANGCISNGPVHNEIDYSVIQLNHYKCKTLPEFRYARSRGRADLTPSSQLEDIDASFKVYDINDEVDLTAYTFYKNIA